MVENDLEKIVGKGNILENPETIERILRRIATLPRPKRPIVSLNRLISMSCRGLSGGPTRSVLPWSP